MRRSTRRGFFGALVGIAAGTSAAALTPTQSTSIELRQLAELERAFERLRAQMEKPIKLTMVLDGRKIAEQVVADLPRVAAGRGRRRGVCAFSCAAIVEPVVRNQGLL